MPDTSNQAIGRRLTAVREARGWTQVYAASLLGLSYQRWGHYERGQRFPPPDILAKFWQLTGATSDYILFGHMHALPVELAHNLRTAQDREAGSGTKATAG